MLFSKKSLDMPDTARKEDMGRSPLMNGLPNRLLLKPKEVAAFLSVSERTVYRWFQQGLIAGIRIRKSLRITRDSISNLLDKSRSGV
jgi:excisionase family DNA binding protein